MGASTDPDTTSSPSAEEHFADVLTATDFALAVLKSERVRVLGMMLLFLLTSAIGVLRLVVPLEGNRTLGMVVLSVGVAALCYEGLILRAIGIGLRNEGAVNRMLMRSISVVEPLIPLVLLWTLMLAMPHNRFLFISGAGYPLLLAVVILSVLRLEPKGTAICGGIASVGYLHMVITALAWNDGAKPPHPIMSYVFLFVFFAVCCGATHFVSMRVRRYVVLAVREMQTRRERDHLQNELELASEIQRRLLPPDEPVSTQFDIAAMSRPAAQAGGDYYDWQELSDGRLLVSLADVTGHGIGPAMVTSACRAYVRANAADRRDTKEIITKVNDLLHSDLEDGKFVTFALIELDPETHRGTFLSAGHGPNYFVRATDGDIEAVGSQGLPLGIIADQDVDEPFEFAFNPGDAVVLTSDGFFEWANAENEQFGTERLTEVIRTNRHEPAARIIEAMDHAICTFVGNRIQDDDMTAVVIRRNA